jgi:multidrug efflux pump
VYQVEDLITRTLEEKIREIGEVDDVWSSSQDGRTTIYVEVDDWVTGPESSASGRCCATR